MLKNHLLVAFRSLQRRGGTTAMNVVGLGLGCAVALLFGLLARDLLTFDRGYDGADEVYIVLHDLVMSDGTRRVDETWSPLWPAIEAELPAAAAGTRVMRHTHQVEVAGRVFPDERVVYADAGYFEVFPFPFLRGNPATAFAESDAAVLARPTAEAFFGEEDPIGQTITLDGTHTVTVTGVAEPQRNHSAAFGLLVNWAQAERHVRHVRRNADNWNASFLKTYLRLRPGADPDALDTHLAGLLERHRSPDEARVALSPLPEHTAEQYGINVFSTVFLLLGLGVLMMAAANFTNLATAQSLQRAREIGVRKSLGAGRAGIAGGVLIETGLVATAAVLLGLGIAHGAEPWINRLLDGATVSVRLDYGDARFWAALAGLAALVTCLAGTYPALFLTRFQAAGVLKGRLMAQPGGRRLRSGLVVFQFALTVILLTTALTIHRQVRHLTGLGFDFGETPVVVVPLADDAFADREASAQALRTLRDDLRRHASVAEAALSTSIPGAYHTSSRLEVDGAERRIDARVAYVDRHYFDLYGIDFTTNVSFGALSETGDERAVVANQRALAATGHERADALRLRPGGDATWEVVGVTEDFAYRSLREPVGPAVHVLSPDVAFGYLSVRSATADPGPLLDLLQTQWPETGATRALTTFFADERYAREALGQEEALRSFVGYAALFATIIALVGLVGLAALVAAQRTKEIGVRKVLGATTTQLVVLLTRQFAGLIGVASLLAAPLALLAANAWLGRYPYHIGGGAELLLIVTAGVLTVAASAVALRTARTAAAAPVEALRHE